MRTFLFLTLAMSLLTTVNYSQSASCPAEFNLPPATIGVEYEADIISALGDCTPTLKGSKTNQILNYTPDFRYSVNPKTVPKGLAIYEDGRIKGKLYQVTENGPFKIAVRIIDYKNTSFSLTISLNLVVQNASISLEKADNLEKTDDREKTILIKLSSESQKTSKTKKNSTADLDQKDPTVVDALVSILKDKQSTKEAKVYAAETLSGMDKGSVSSLSALADCLASNEAEVATAAKRALDKITSQAERDSNGLTMYTGTVKDDYGNSVQDAEIQLTEVNGNVRQATRTDEHGSYIFNNLPQSNYRVNVNHPGFTGITGKAVNLDSSSEQTDTITLMGIRPRSGGQFSRLVLGFEQSGATASRKSQNFFLDGYLSVPFPWHYKSNEDSFYGPRLRLWGDVRLASAPDPMLGEKGIGDFVRSFADTAEKTPVKDVIQTFEGTGGIEYRLVGTDRPQNNNEPGVKSRFSLSLIAGGGIIAPIDPSETASASVFEVTPKAVERYPIAEGKKYIGFVAPDRDRFYRQYFGGVRFQTFYLNNGEQALDRYPGTLDLTFGQNEAATGGRLRGGIMKLEGFFPLPIGDRGALFIFGTAQMKFVKSHFEDPLILKQASSVTLPNDDAAIITLFPKDRDYYRIGFGVDPIKLFRNFTGHHTP